MNVHSYKNISSESQELKNMLILNLNKKLFDYNCTVWASLLLQFIIGLRRGTNYSLALTNPLHTNL